MCCKDWTTCTSMALYMEVGTFFRSAVTCKLSSVPPSNELLVPAPGCRRSKHNAAV
jgi:hypothetical protein